MSFRNWLIHTCVIEDNAGTAFSAIGELVDDWQPESTVSCRYVIDRERRGSEAESAQFVTVTKLLLPATATVDNTKRVTNVTLEDSTVLSGPFNIEQVLPRRAKSLRHITLILEEVS